MKSHPRKLKTTTSRPLFSCAFFRHCTQSVTSPTTSLPPSLPLSSDPPPPLSPPVQKPCSSSSSSSNSSSQSFTQWKFSPSLPPPPPPSLPLSSLSDPIEALKILEKSADVACPREVLAAAVGLLTSYPKPATKVLLALCLAEENRRVAVEEGAAGRVVEALADLDGGAAERALATLELLCTVSEGAEEVRGHALAVPMMVEVMGRMAGRRGKEYAISVLAVIYGGRAEREGGERGERGEREGGIHAPPEAVAGVVRLALQGDCSARGRRKGAQLLKILEENGPSDGVDE